MKLYEGLFVFTSGSGSETTDEQLKNLEKVLAKFEVKVLKKDDWSKRPLGYEIKKQKEGHFFIFDFEAEPSKIDSLRRALELHEGLLKYMITHKVIVEASAPSAPDAKKAKAPAEKTQTVTTK